MKIKIVYECSVCGSTNVQVAVLNWFDPNTNEGKGEGDEIHANFCNECEDDTGPLSRKEVANESG